MSDLALPAAREALDAGRGRPATEIDLLDRRDRDARHGVPVDGGAPRGPLGSAEAAAYDLSAGCTGFMYAIAQAYGMIAGGLSRKALVVGGDVLSSILDWTDRSTLVLFGDGAGAVVMEQVDPTAASSASSSAPTAPAASSLWLPGSGSREFEDA